MSFFIPWARYANLFKIIEFFSKAKGGIDKKLFGNLFYLSFSGENSIAYDFSLYSHGIYSDQLSSDLEMLESLKALKIDEIKQRIIIGKPSELLEEKFQLDESFEKIRRKLEKVNNLLSIRGEKDLELITTITFLDQEISDEQKQKEIFHEIKPALEEGLIDNLFIWFKEFKNSFKKDHIELANENI